MKVHIGEKIKEVMAKRGMGTEELGRRIGKVRQTISGYLNREGIESDILLDISNVLEFDFFQYYRTQSFGQEVPKAPSSVSITLVVPQEYVGAVLKAGFGDFNGNVLLNFLPDASQSIS